MSTSTRVLPVSLMCLSLALVACDKSKDKAADAKSDAKSDTKAEDKADKPSGEPAAEKTDGPAAKPVTAAAPQGRDAADNHKPLIDALAKIESCKLNAEGDDVEGDCPGLDDFYALIDDAKDEDKAAIDRTMVNLLGDSNDLVRWSIADSIGVNELPDDAHLGTALVALSSEKNKGIAERLSASIWDLDPKRLYGPALVSNMKATLAAVAYPQSFEELVLKGRDTLEDEAYAALLLEVAANPNLENKAIVLDELSGLKLYKPEICTLIADTTITLSKAPAPGEDAEFYPHQRAASGVQHLQQFSLEVDGKDQTCGAELPKLLDALLAQAKDGSLDIDVFDSATYIDKREDKDQYMDKLKTLAEAVVANGKLDAEIKDVAKSALDDWKQG